MNYNKILNNLFKDDINLRSILEQLNILNNIKIIAEKEKAINTLQYIKQQEQLLKNKIKKFTCK